MVFKLGSLNHAKGYVINKLFEQQRYGGRHLPVIYLSQGYPSHLKHLVTEGIEELRKEGVIQIVKKRTGRGYGDHAVLVKAKLGEARGLLNGFRAAADLPRLGTDLKSFLPVK
ncbi:MAG: hypothetical protein ACLP5V_14900 [Candidatus Bathyarchaeia archaeon]